jgi:hypothetical protein
MKTVYLNTLQPIEKLPYTTIISTVDSIIWMGCFGILYAAARP